MKIIAIVLSVFISGSISAQEYTFKVLISKGQNEIKAGDAWLPVKVGASLRSADALRVSQNGYIGLVHVSGKPLEVKEAGQHQVSELAAKIKEGSSVLNQYTDFILSTNNDERNNLTATGAVHRGLNDINVFLPKPQHSIFFNNEIAIAWSSLPETDTYVVSFNSMFGDVLDKLEVQDTTLLIDLNTRKFVKEDNILVKVTSKSDPNKGSDPMVLKKLSPADKKRINASLSEIVELTREATALNQLFLASFYESHSLFIDASTAYQKAIKLAPNVPQFRISYDDFIDRNGLKD